MKTEFLLLTSLLGLSGCQTAPVSLPPAVAPLPPAPVPVVADVRVPEVVKTYTLGAYVDPDDPTLRHEAHQVQRIVSSARWNLAPAVAVKPAPAVSETAPDHADNSQDQRPSPVVTTIPAVPAAAITPEPASDPEPALVPNADGLIDLTAAVGADGTEVNPFAVRKLPTEAVRETTLLVAGIVAGAKPCAVINEKLVEPGAVIEGFTVARIEPAAVVLQWGEHRLRLPLSDKPTRVRVAF